MPFTSSLNINGHFRNLKLEVPTIYKAYFSGLCEGISPENMAWNMVQYLHFRILKFPLIIGKYCWQAQRQQNTAA